jgi:hypothetical protein
MQGAEDITKLKFVYGNESIEPISTWISELNSVYIKFRKADNTTINIAAEEIKNYVTDENRN